MVLLFLLNCPIFYVDISLSYFILESLHTQLYETNQKFTQKVGKLESQLKELELQYTQLTV